MSRLFDKGKYIRELLEEERDLTLIIQEINKETSIHTSIDRNIRIIANHMQNLNEQIKAVHEPSDSVCHSMKGSK